MRVRTTIKYVVEYQLIKEFYDTKVEEEILKLERAYVQAKPSDLIELLTARDRGTVTTSVEMVCDTKNVA